MSPARVRYLTKRPGSNKYYVRVPVPLHLQAELGRKEVWRSLGTSDLRHAKAKTHRTVAGIQDEWRAAAVSNTAAEVPKEPTRQEMEDAALRYFAIQVDSDLDERIHDPAFVKQFYDRKRYKKAFKELAERFALGDYSGIDADYWGETFGLYFKAGSPKRREFAQLLMRAELEATRRFADHDRGRLGEPPHDQFFSRQVSIAESPAEERHPAVAEKHADSLLELFELHREHQSNHLKADTLEQRVKAVRRFSEFVGKDMAPQEVTKAMARDWRNNLRKWPVKADQRKEFYGLDFLQIIKKNEKCGIPPITAVTRGKYLSEVSAFFTWLRREGYVAQNVFDDLHEVLPRDKAESRSFTNEQLKHLFSSPLFSGCQDASTSCATPGGVRVSDWRYWLPILALFTGARQGELAQLEVDDVRFEDGINFLRITNQGEDPLKSVKNAYSHRSVPLHARLINLGFLEIVEAKRSVGEPRVFSEIKRDARGAFGNVSKFYQKYFRQIGLTESSDRKVVFHSFRHRFVDELRKNFTEDQIRPLLGHSGRTTTGGYGEREALSLQRRGEMVETLEFDFIEWPSSPRESL